MVRIRISNGTHRKSEFARYEFTVVLLPVFEATESGEARPDAKPSNRFKLRNPAKPTGYQVSVPSLPGLITFGRTEAEAWAMAQDAIRCHIDGLRKDGLPIPDESSAHFRKLRISA